MPKQRANADAKVALYLGTLSLHAKRAGMNCGPVIRQSTPESRSHFGGEAPQKIPNYE